MVQPTSWSQPSMFGAQAIRLRVDVLFDPLEQSAIYSIEAREFPSRELRALWSTGPRHIASGAASLAELDREFHRLFYELTQPFPAP